MNLSNQYQQSMSTSSITKIDTNKLIYTKKNYLNENYRILLKVTDVSKILSLILYIFMPIY